MQSNYEFWCSQVVFWLNSMEFWRLNRSPLHLMNATTQYQRSMVKADKAL